MVKNKKPQVIVNLPNPGMCQSDLMRENDALAYRIIQWIFVRTTEVGGRTLVAGIVAGPETHGKYMSESVYKR